MNVYISCMLMMYVFIYIIRTYIVFSPFIYVPSSQNTKLNLESCILPRPLTLVEVAEGQHSQACATSTCLVPPTAYL